MNNNILLNIRDYLNEINNDSISENYNVPISWCKHLYPIEKSQISSIDINPIKLFIDGINFILSTADFKNNYHTPLSMLNHNEKHDNWIRKSSIYCAHIRTLSAWDHDKSSNLETLNVDGYRETGTFLKTILILPLIKQCGFNTIYMLPLSQNSDKYKKGELGSPYAVKNFFKLDNNLKDPILKEFTVEDEFKALIEAAHILNIRVVVDIIPRTCARDAHEIIENPNWFYWIKKECKDSYKPPIVDGIYGEALPSYDNLKKIYNSPEVMKHLGMFTLSPNELNPDKWANIKEQLQQVTDPLSLIESEFNVTTAPAFSVCINDQQPIWSDITMLKFYMDNPNSAKEYITKEQAPYILYDSIQTNLFPGEIINENLWGLITNIIPYYQKNFGIDGARIDMGHALPTELERRMIKKAQIYDPNFCLISEELENDKSEKASESGYNAIVGSCWWNEPRVHTGSLHELIHYLPKMKLPLLASAELPDTPRALMRNNKKFIEAMTVINFFLPNSLPFINNGYEMYEDQPMNIGMDFDDILKEKSPSSIGKLAFFDKYSFKWNEYYDSNIHQLIKVLNIVRNKYIDSIIDPQKYININTYNNLIINCYKVQNNVSHLLIIITSIDFENKIQIPTQVFLDLSISDNELLEKTFLILSNQELKEEIQVSLMDLNGIHRELEPGSSKIFIIKE